MKLELKSSFLCGLLIGLLLVLLFGKPRCAERVNKQSAEKPAAKPEPARPPSSWHNRPGARSYTGKRTIDVEAQQAEQANFDAETDALDTEAFGPMRDVYTSLRERKAQMEQARS